MKIRITPGGYAVTVIDVLGVHRIYAQASQVERGISLQISSDRNHDCSTIRIPRDQIPELEALIEQAKRDDLATSFEEKG